MILAKRVIPILGSAVVAGAYVLLLLSPSQWKVAAVILTLWLIGSVLHLLHWRFLSLSFWAALTPIAALIFGGTGLLFFVDVSVARWIFVVIMVIVYALYTETLFVYHYQPQIYANLSLPRLSLYVLTVGGACLFMFLWALNLIGLMPVWLLTVLAAAYMATMLLHILYSFQLWSDANFYVIAVLSLLFAETVWVMQFWSVSYYISGAILGLLLYALPSVMLMHWRGALNRQVALRYAIMTFVAIILILATSQWV
ncbi:MAG: hypothetical protein COW24_02670 [Candidatus Kerfeldbacteria bacterium CG15_BIG_FIL_POST_REV_8_21_14_020_45_12]|uniref:Uncharacterized protein n=1 Tax=Candidatus Kerfeldbacteria bacterium CG15_BIG_FIL_POST_REV_8_21_14_020_45_12 TaxID=2014247 RepID=A0A2M7H409_9BACT|nr:MAG: hypothetical protein COW24_02670 [Candidatus Kerfeldbacteria bacterium CG15_BIG_FIL_POST_REV_8_21_14_020_45_12]PJA93108.1 MAG: hypothetical protein CO132_04655 [Candidatus Kerfeldbacteria bacterium CG_4_9_14_3_um_filter_45_8]